MKRFFIAAVAFVLTAGFVGCSKVEESPIVDGSNDVRVEFSVAEMDGFDSTRAVKSGWEAGDQIFVFFSANGSWLLADGSKANSVTLTYDGSEWSAYANGVDETLLSSASGTFFAVHYPGVLNHLTLGLYDRFLFDGYEGGEILSAVGNYTIVDNVIKLPTLSLKMDAKAVQFSVKNLESLGGNWQLLVNKDRVKANGYSDADAIFLFGRASNSTEIKKFTSALLQSMEKGGAELSVFLARQSSELWSTKRQHMLQNGEKAATKLLLPIVLIFVGIIIIVMTAAFAGSLF